MKDIDDLFNQAIGLHQQGKLAQARTLYAQIVERAPAHAKTLNLLGASYMQAGEYLKAISFIEQALRANPDLPEAHNNLGTALKGLQRFDEAAACYRKALALKPDYALALYNLGLCLKELGRVEEATACFRKMLATHPAEARAHHALGLLLYAQGQADEALACYRMAIAHKPADAQLHCMAGNILLQQGQLEAAVESLSTAVSLKPDFTGALNNLSFALQKLGRLDEAEAHYRQALRLQPDFAQGYYNLGNTLLEQGRLVDAEVSFRQALELLPDYPDARNNLGNTLLELRRPIEAEACYRQALQLDPGHEEANNNLGRVLLLTGRLPEGWRGHEHRWEGGSPRMQRPRTHLPQWTGQPPAPHDALLIFTEQGMGDKLQFCRYLTLAAQRFAGRVSVIVDRPLLGLLGRSFPGIEFLESVPADQSAWQWHCPLLSLPLAFNTTLQSIPDKVPYLAADAMGVARWRARIEALGLPASARKIGVVWKSGTFMQIARLKSLTLKQISPLLMQPGCAWFSLQKEPDADKASWVAQGLLVDWADELGDFDDTAALAMNLDLIVSVDTAVAHLAGGLGKPVWLFNRYASDWRWLLDRDDSPWYPSMRLFSQKTPEDRDEVVRRMSHALGEFIA
jgi:tetratricopeptide (TPR) repeat protein